MSTLEDKILDGPTINYCDADNDDIRTEENSDDVSDDESKNISKNDASSLFRRPEEGEGSSSAAYNRPPGCSTNTGPKGVIEDYRKQAVPKNKKLASTDDLDAEFQKLLNDDSILKEIARKRMSERSNDVPTFGQVYRLQMGSELLDAIDKENPNVLIIAHIYTKYSRTCARVDRCLDQLAAEHKYMKIVTLDASVAGLSDNFKENGVPALLAYRNSNLVKSLVQLEDLLDKDFGYNQIKDLLVDNELII